MEALCKRFELQLNVASADVWNMIDVVDFSMPLLFVAEMILLLISSFTISCKSHIMQSELEPIVC